MVQLFPPSFGPYNYIGTYMKAKEYHEGLEPALSITAVSVDELFVYKWSRKIKDEDIAPNTNCTVLTTDLVDMDRKSRQYNAIVQYSVLAQLSIAIGSAVCTMYLPKFSRLPIFGHIYIQLIHLWLALTWFFSPYKTSEPMWELFSTNKVSQPLHVGTYCPKTIQYREMSKVKSTNHKCCRLLAIFAYYGT